MKLTLRELFWLVLVVGLALGWWLDTSIVRKERDRAIAKSKLDESVMAAVTESANPFIVAGESLSPDAKREFNQAFLAYIKASPDEKQKMLTEAKTKIGKEAP